MGHLAFWPQSWQVALGASALTFLVIAAVVLLTRLGRLRRRWALEGKRPRLRDWTALFEGLPRALREDHELHMRVFRCLGLATLFFGAYYLTWRYSRSINWDALWFSIPLLLAETYSFVGAALFVFTLWRQSWREPPPPPENATVDVFITCYNEPPEVVRRTAEAAIKIRYPHKTYILDDGRREAIRRIAEEVGCGYITRVDNRHAKAGNINNALEVTNGEFILVLDADMIPEPDILDRTLGYFRDEKVAFVQTPQRFYNVPPGDPFDANAPLFYGPILRGKDAWNAAFFCGTNAVLRREALIRMGLFYYVEDMERALKKALTDAWAAVERARWLMERSRGVVELARVRERFERARAAIRKARRALKEGETLSKVISLTGEAVPHLDSLRQSLQRVREDLLAMAADLKAVAQSGEEPGASEARRRLEELAPATERCEQAVRVVQEAAEEVRRTVNIEVTPMATISLTEDLATSVRLHRLGWKSVYHDQVLARGLAPEDLGSTLKQRLRWAQGTLQVFLRERALIKRGLTLAQRLHYFTTLYGYFYFFAAVIYFLWPPIYLLTEIPPVRAYSAEFFWRIVPYLAFNQLMFEFIGWGIPTWRGRQYFQGLFPVWIRALVSVLSGRKLTFHVTPKTRQEGIYLGLIRPQLAICCLTVLGILWGIVKLALGWSREFAGILTNVFWGLYNLLMLSAVVRAAVWRPKERKVQFELEEARAAHPR